MKVWALLPARMLLFVFGLTTFLTWALLTSAPGFAELVQVKNLEGVTHGFLVLRAPDNTIIADGDMIQYARGPRVTARLVFHFKDGSLSDETAVFTQGQQFRLVTDRMIQTGPSFPQPIDMTINVGAGLVTVRYVDHGEQKSDVEHMRLTPDLVNGIIQTLLKNVDASHPPKAWPYIVATPKPQLVKLVLSVNGTDKFTTDGMTRTATQYVLKVEIGGVKGLLAPLVGKRPPDAHVWISEGEAPAFIRAEQSFYVGGPVWGIELSSPKWHNPPP
jgi:hypothetical protein